MTAKSMGRTKQIAVGFDRLCMREHTGENLTHLRFEFRTDTATIKIHDIHLIGIKLWQEFFIQDMGHSVNTLVKRIEALGLES